MRALRWEKASHHGCACGCGNGDDPPPVMLQEVVIVVREVVAVDLLLSIANMYC